MQAATIQCKQPRLYSDLDILLSRVLLDKIYMSGHQSIHPPYRISPGKAQESSSYPREILVKIDKTRRESCQPPWVLHQGFICPWMVASTKNQAHIPVKYSIRLIRQARNGNRTNRILLRLLLGLEVKTRSNQEGIPASLAFLPVDADGSSFQNLLSGQL